MTPFVSSWNPAVDAWDRPRSDSFLGKNLLRELEQSNLGRRAGSAGRIERLLANFVDSRAGIGTGAIYRTLGEMMINALRPLLQVEDEKCEYLAPIAQAASRDGGLAVATLNYDTTVEQAARVAGVTPYTGIESWCQNRKWNWPGEGLRLLKLHGSIDWCWDTSPTTQDQFPYKRVIPAPPMDPAAARRSPALVFGQRSKLTAEGPFLSLLAEFEQALEIVERLVVVGYSFRDEHVNEVIRRWCADSPSRSIVIVDPSLDTAPDPRGKLLPGGIRVTTVPRQLGFRSELFLRLNPGQGDGEKSPRVWAVTRPAKAVLAQLLAAGSPGDVDSPGASPQAS